MKTLTQDRSIKLEGYSFDEKKHAHTLNGKPLYGVTTVLKVIGKGDALVQWSANMAVEYIAANLPSAITFPLDPKKLTEVLEAGKKAWCKTRDTAGGFGTHVHGAIEEWVKIGTYSPLEDEAETKAVENFITWAKENSITFLECEKHVFSKEMWVGGILDLVFEKEGKIYIGDIKTSKGIYPEYFFQMGAYDICINEMNDKYKNVDGYTIINLKKTGQIEVESNYGRDQNKEAFKCALSLYKILNETKKTI